MLHIRALQGAWDPLDLVAISDRRVRLSRAQPAQQVHLRRFQGRRVLPVVREQSHRFLVPPALLVQQVHLLRYQGQRVLLEVWVQLRRYLARRGQLDTSEQLQPYRGPLGCEATVSQGQWVPQAIQAKMGGMGCLGRLVMWVKRVQLVIEGIQAHRVPRQIPVRQVQLVLHQQFLVRRVRLGVWVHLLRFQGQPGRLGVWVRLRRFQGQRVRLEVWVLLQQFQGRRVLLEAWALLQQFQGQQVRLEVWVLLRRFQGRLAHEAKELRGQQVPEALVKTVKMVQLVLQAISVERVLLEIEDTQVSLALPQIQAQPVQPGRLRRFQGQLDRLGLWVHLLRFQERLVQLAVWGHLQQFLEPQGRLAVWVLLRRFPEQRVRLEVWGRLRQFQGQPGRLEAWELLRRFQERRAHEAKEIRGQPVPEALEKMGRTA